MPHFEVSSFLAAAIGLLGFVSLCLLVFGRLGIGSIVAFLVAGLLVGTIRDLPDESVWRYANSLNSALSCCYF